MMISPESFIEMNIKGKTREKALKKVKKLRKEIRRLKKTVEENPYSDECQIHPSPEVQISVSRDYLLAAREYFKSQGWDYEPSKKEIKDREFNEHLDSIKSIEIYYGGFFQGGKRWEISFDKDRIVVDSILRHMPEFDETDLELPCFDDMTRSDFISELRAIHMGEWKKDYFNPDILDGTQWSVDIKYDGGEKRHYSGSNMFPYNFNEFLDVVREENYRMNTK